MSGEPKCFECWHEWSWHEKGASFPTLSAFCESEGCECDEFTPMPKNRQTQPAGYQL